MALADCGRPHRRGLRHLQRPHVPAVDIGFEVDDYGTSGPFLFSLVTPAWRLPYRATFEPGGLTYAPLADDAEVASRPSPVPMRTRINKNKPTLFLDGDRMITDEDRLLAPRTDLPPFPRDRLQAISWDGVDIRVESQGPQRRADSIQARMSVHLPAKTSMSRSTTIALARQPTSWASRSAAPNCTSPWCTANTHQNPPQAPGSLTCTNSGRPCAAPNGGSKARSRSCSTLTGAPAAFARTGTSPYEAGTISDMFRIRELAPQLRPRFHTVLAQPGLSAARATGEQLRLLAGAESYVRAVTRGTFDVICSP